MTKNLHASAKQFAKLPIEEQQKKLYPQFISGADIRKFVVPITGVYHARLFPEAANPLHDQMTIFQSTSIDAIPGNSIRKVYLCLANNRKIRAGDILIFYVSKNSEHRTSQAVSTLGVVETVALFVMIFIQSTLK